MARPVLCSQSFLKRRARSLSVPSPFRSGLLFEHLKTVSSMFKVLLHAMILLTVGCNEIDTKNRQTDKGKGQVYLLRRKEKRIFIVQIKVFYISTIIQFK